MKKTIAVFALVAVIMLMSANSASAAWTIRGTGDESTVNSSSNFLVNLFNRFFNNSTINNDTVDSSASSGSNTLVGADDSGDWEITTGDTTSATLAENGANTTEVSGDIESSDSADVLVEDTTDESTVNQSTTDALEDDEQIENNQEVNNDLSSSTDTGSNSGVSGDELYRATVKTGTSDSATGSSNVFNLIMKMWNRTISR